MTNSQFLKWIHDRLQFVHNENPSLDYMQRLMDISEDAKRLEELMERMRK